MKIILKILLFISLAILVSCTSDNINSGIKGYIEYAEADCAIDQSFWTYNPYNGMIYAIPKDSILFANGNYKALSDSTQAINGNFQLGLEPGYYYIFLDEHRSFNSTTEFKVQLNQVTEKEFRLHSCI